MAIILNQVQPPHATAAHEAMSDSMSGDNVTPSEISLDGAALIGVTLAIFVVAILARPLLGVMTFFLKYIILLAIIFGLVSYFGILQ